MPTAALAPVLYIPHGGGPLPLLGEPGHAELVDFLRRIPQSLPRPRAILVVSAHWEAARPTVQSTAQPALYYDYSNFPAEAYRLQYPASGSPALAQQVLELLGDRGFSAAQESERGYDHGAFVPLMLMYPAADIPCLQLSLIDSLDAVEHIALGRALAALRQQGVMILGSGSSYHNLQPPRTGIDPGEAEIAAFDQWLCDSCCAATLTSAEREQRLSNWLSAPQARFCHPREEHLLPLQVCFGAATVEGVVTPAEQVYGGQIMGRRVLSFLWR